MKSNGKSRMERDGMLSEIDKMRMGWFIRLAATAAFVSVLAAGCQFGGDAFKAEFT